MVVNLIGHYVCDQADPAAIVIRNDWASVSINVALQVLQEQEVDGFQAPC